MTKTITDILPDALQSPRNSGSFALKPAYQALPYEQAWQTFLATAADICPGFYLSADHAQLYANIMRYCMLDPTGPCDPAKGLWICGNIGTGKSTLLALVRQFCDMVRMPWPALSTDFSFYVANASSLAGVYQAEGIDGLAPYVESRRFAIDDLGAEPIPVSHYGDSLNVIQYLLQVRYDRRRDAFTHVTTNISIPQIADLYGERVADRVTEMFNFVTLLGASHRSKEAAAV